MEGKNLFLSVRPAYSITSCWGERILGDFRMEDKYGTIYVDLWVPK